MSRRSRPASWGAEGSTASTTETRSQHRRIWSTTSRTERPASAGPKFHASAKCSPSSTNRRPKHEVSAQRFEHELPGPHGVGIADRRRVAGRGRDHHVGHESVLGPVAAADDVAGPGRGTWHRTVGKNDRRIAAVTSSAHALLELYGSCPPSGSVST